MVNDVLVAKLASLTRCLDRVREEYNPVGEFDQSLSRQDAAILNIQRACETTIDIANKIVSFEKLGLPSNSRGSFDLLSDSSVITTEIATRMKKMVGFRKIAVHEYQKLEIEIVKSVIEKHLVDFEEFAKAIKTYLLESQRDDR